MNPAAIHAYLLELQNRIVAELERVEGRSFRRDPWQREEGGGESRIIEDGDVFERGGVNFSRVHGERLPPSASAARRELAGRAFEATGVSLVLHPRNPYVPTVHMDVRFLVATKPPSEPIWSFRRGRYVEFNPVYQRGVLFGLQSAGRAESILMSLPPLVKWRYDWKPEPSSAEGKLYRDFLRARDWLGE